MCSRPYRPFGLPIYVARAPRLHSRSYPRRFTFYVADPISSIETRSLPTLARSYPRRFTFYVADPISSIPARSFALPSFQRSPIMHHKPLMMLLIHELTVPRARPLRLTQPPLHRFAELLYRKRLMMDQILLPEL